MRTKEEKNLKENKDIPKQNFKENLQKNLDEHLDKP